MWYGQNLCLLTIAVKLYLASDAREKMVVVVRSFSLQIYSDNRRKFMMLL